ncbi:MAG: GntR family transcriptional regulator [Eubacteriales bacterium]
MITIDYTDRTPIYEQIVHSIERLIALGVLVPEEKLPTVRTLGIELSTNHNTIQKAYALLEQRGTIYSVKGIGNFVSKIDLKTKMTEETLELAHKNLQTAVLYGLTEAEFDQWIETQRREFYDHRNED